MALTRVKTWVANEVLTASDLNAEFDNIVNNAPTLISPLSDNLDLNGNQLIIDADGDSHIVASSDDVFSFVLGGSTRFTMSTTQFDINGLELVLDADADTSIQSDTDDRIDFNLGGVELFRMTGTTASSVNGLNLEAVATGNNPRLDALGTDTDISLELRSKGAGDIVLADDSGNEILIANDVASAVNEITIENAVTTEAPEIQATGDDTNIDIDLIPKGSGRVAENGSYVRPTFSAEDATTSGTGSVFTSFPSWAKRVQINFRLVSLNGTDNLLLQLGDSGGMETTGYTSSAVAVDNSGGTSGVTSTSGIIIPIGDAAQAITGVLLLNNMDGDQWVASYSLRMAGDMIAIGGGHKQLSATFTQLQIVPTGSDEFDNGAISVSWE